MNFVFITFLFTGTTILYYLLLSLLFLHLYLLTLQLYLLTSYTTTYCNPTLTIVTAICCNFFVTTSSIILILRLPLLLFILNISRYTPATNTATTPITTSFFTTVLLLVLLQILLRFLLFLLLLLPALLLLLQHQYYSFFNSYFCYYFYFYLQFSSSTCIPSSTPISTDTWTPISTPTCGFFTIPTTTIISFVLVSYKWHSYTPYIVLLLLLLLLLWSHTQFFYSLLPITPTLYITVPLSPSLRLLPLLLHWESVFTVRLVDFTRCVATVVSFLERPLNFCAAVLWGWHWRCCWRFSFGWSEKCASFSTESENREEESAPRQEARGRWELGSLRSLRWGSHRDAGGTGRRPLGHLNWQFCCWHFN